MSDIKYDYEDQFTDALKSINDNNIKLKLVAIKNLVVERLALERQFKAEHNKLEFKYEEMYKPIYEKRQRVIEGKEAPQIEEIKDKLEALKISQEEAKKVIDETSQSPKEAQENSKENANENGQEKEEAIARERGIPEFWSKCLLNNSEFIINEKDKNILKKLKEITCETEENGNFKLIYKFYPNIYFTNETLVREFILDDDFDIKSIKSDVIEWKSDEVNPTINMVHKKVKNKRTKQVKVVLKKEIVPSFFTSFKNYEKSEKEKDKKDEEDDEENEENEENDITDEFDLALQLKDEIIPYAIEHYLGIAEGDGGEEDEEDELGEEEEEEYEDSKNKRRGGRGNDMKKY